MLGFLDRQIALIDAVARPKVTGYNPVHEEGCNHAYAT
jgi:hypothetical protein